MSNERLNFVKKAKLAEQAERYDEMVDQMGKVAKMDVELTVEERNLLSVAYKNKHREVFHFTSPYSVPSDAHGTTPCQSTRAYARAPVAYLPPLRLRRRLASAPRTMIASPAWFAKASGKFCDFIRQRNHTRESVSKC